jgi:hypothetical protein
VNFRRKENAVERGCWSVDGALLRVLGGSVMADVLALSSSSYKLGTRILQSLFLGCCAIGFLGCICKKVLLPKACVSLENNC